MALEETVFVIIFVFTLLSFFVAGFLVFTNPIEAFTAKYVGWFGSYYYSDFFSFVLLGLVLTVIYRKGLYMIWEVKEKIVKEAKHNGSMHTDNLQRS